MDTTIRTGLGRRRLQLRAERIRPCLRSHVVTLGRRLARAHPDANSPACNPDDSCGFTSTIHLRSNPTSRIDFIWARGLTATADVHVRLPGDTFDPYRTLSDHMPVSAVVDFSPVTP